MMFNEEFWILICFLSMLFLAYRLYHKKLTIFLKNKIQEIKHNIDNTQKEYIAANYKLEQINRRLIEIQNNTQIKYKDTQAEIEKIKHQKFIELDRYIQNKKADLEKELVQIKTLAEVQIKHEIIDKSQILVLEYLKNSDYYSDSDKKEVLENLLKDLKIN